MNQRLLAKRVAQAFLPLAAITLSALLLGVYAGGGSAYLLGFVALVPWLLSLQTRRSWSLVLLSGWVMTVAFVLAVFGWFGAAFGAYVGVSQTSAILTLLLLAPVLQPQILVYVLARHWARQRHGPTLSALAGACAWVGCEWVWPKLLGDTLGHGLHASASLRQLADLGGAAGLSLVLILCNEAFALALLRARQGMRALIGPLAAVAGIVLLMLGYGSWRLANVQAAQAQPAASIRIGLIQANISGYEALRKQIGSHGVVRHVLDTHFAMSTHAIREQGAQALLWSETVYPTTFGQPKSADGAAFDREIMDFVETNEVPLLFGTYDLDASGEYNSAALIDPGRGLLGHYRKTHPFPFTEHVPTWLDGPLLRRLLPWTGGWQAGEGPRVLPLRTVDGREVDVLPLICLDDVRSQLAIDGARLGAQAILGMSNDSWFTAHPDGARLHLAVAAFRSIETRLPQLRVTTNGLSAIIDETGEVVARTEMGQQAVLVGEIPVRPAMPSPLVQSGDWVGRAGLLVLTVLALRRLASRQLALRSHAAGWPAHTNSVLVPRGQEAASTFSAEVLLLSPAARTAIGLLRMLAALGLLWLGASMLRGDGLQVSSLAQIEQFALTVALPLLTAWALQRASAAKASIHDGYLRLTQARQEIEIPQTSIAQLRAWWMPLPTAGVDLLLGSGRRFEKGLATRDAQRLLQSLQAAGSPARWSDAASAQIGEHAQLRAAAARPRFDRLLTKFMLLPLLPALIAFHLHQNIAYGGPFGELLTYGFTAWATGVLIWWASWVIGLMMLAAVIRTAIELGVLATWSLAEHRGAVRRWLEDAARMLYYLGVPIWLLLRILLG
ncbi:MAG: apolipoprotein N-acyltransferase [Pseudomarimonas sp.]